ncbi:MAG: hypothetical protein LBT51_01555 [Fusobacteriaceae bacterium]|jgi:hypothetical protein|nr:hypothetical protein [Fusobacteriaceae bacterium]
MRVKFEYKSISKEIILSKINLFYGYNNSGKTYLAKLFNDGFNQKIKSLFLVNGVQVGKNDYEVIFVNSKENIDDHVKFTSKSILRKIFMNKIIENINKEGGFEDYLYKKFESINENLVKMLENFNNELNAKINISLEMETLEDFIANYVKITFSQDDISSSSNKINFYKTITEYVISSNNSKIIIIDDFDSFLDEKSTLKFLNMLESIDKHIFILFSNKPTSLTYAIGKYNIFSIRENKLIDLSNIKKMIQYSFFNESEGKHSFEEYVIENKLILLKEEYQILLDSISKNININLGRMLVNKEYSFNIKSNEIIKIIPNSEIEKSYLEYVKQLLEEK